MLTYGEKAWREGCYRYLDNIYICIHESVFKYICLHTEKEQRANVTNTVYIEEYETLHFVYSYMHFGVY